MSPLRSETVERVSEEHEEEDEEAAEEDEPGQEEQPAPGADPVAGHAVTQSRHGRQDSEHATKHDHLVSVCKLLSQSHHDQ